MATAHRRPDVRVHVPLRASASVTWSRSSAGGVDDDSAAYEQLLKAMHKRAPIPVASAEDVASMAAARARSRLEPALRAYKAHVYPSALVYALVTRAGPERHMMRQTLVHSVYEHADVRLRSAGDLRCFLGCGSDDDAAAPRRRHDPYAALHMGMAAAWARVAGSSSSSDGHAVRTTAFEVVLDLDVPAYDEKRRAGLRAGVLCQCAVREPGGKCVCAQCWLLVVLAAEAVRVLLAEHVGLGRPMWVFSGGKGAHCYFGARAARELSRAARESLGRMFASWSVPSTLDALSEQAARDPTSLPGRLCAALRAAWEREGVSGPRAVLRSGRACEWLASFFPGLTEGALFSAAAAALVDGAGRWALFVARAPAAVVCRVLLELGLPLVDVGAFGHRRPTLKLPFSMHAGSGRVACPVPEAALGAFDPRDGAPTVEDAATHPAFAAGVAEMRAWLAATDD